jgi:hypothetical protein
MPESPNYRVTAKNGKVYLTNDAPDADPGLTPDAALRLGEALLLAAREAVRTTTSEPNPYQARRDYFHDPLWAELVRKRLATRWPATELTDDDLADVEAEWRARRERGD